MWGGWYKSEEYMKLHKRLFEIYNQRITAAVMIDRNTLARSAEKAGG